jgi:GMP synthase - Glutamine amidotransferase domain
MILLVNLAAKPGLLSRDEYVGPVARIVAAAGYKWREEHFLKISRETIAGADGIILCGTALKDNAFAEHVQDLAWLRTAACPVLGICAGAEVLCLAYGGRLVPACGIGMTEVRVAEADPLLGGPRTFSAYEVHTFACEPPAGWTITAVSETCVQAFRHPDRPVYGLMFHPEVRNDAVVERFCKLLPAGAPAPTKARIGMRKMRREQ